MLASLMMTKELQKALCYEDPEYNKPTEAMEEQEQKDLPENIDNGKTSVCYFENVLSDKFPMSDLLRQLLTFRTAIVWKNAIGFLLLHVLTYIALVNCIPRASSATTFWAFLMTYSSGVGITIGAHRLHTHRSFKANFGVRLVLVILQTISGQNCLYVWVRDHRQHHRYVDTDADPHNARRGFFFSHMGWLMMRKHPDVIAAGRTISMQDIESDPLLVFQKRWYLRLYVLLSVIFPVYVPVVMWGEGLFDSFMISYVFRSVLHYHITWIVNSWAHVYGTRPFDQCQLATDSWFVAFMTAGEGWHNFHHRFPFDYTCGRSRFNVSASVIEWAQRMGWVTDLRKATPKAMKRAAALTGDGSFHSALLPDTAAENAIHDDG